MQAWKPNERWRHVGAVRRDAIPILYAIAEHRRWAKAIEKKLNEGEVGDVWINAPCRFGEWLRSNPSRSMRQWVDFTEIERLHHYAHHLASDLFEADTVSTATGKGELDKVLEALIDQLNQALDGLQPHLSPAKM